MIALHAAGRLRTGTRCALALLALTAPAAADFLCLKDGRIVEQDTRRAQGGFLIVFEHGEVFVAEELVHEAVIEDEPFVPSTDEEREQAAQGLVPFERRWVTPKRRDELVRRRIEERKEAVEELRAHQKWSERYQESSKHFEFHHTLPPRIFAAYRDAMEAYFEEFARTWKIKQPREQGRLMVNFYSDRDYYEQVSGASPGVVGFFRYVDPMELHFYYDRVDPRYTEEVMFHETNHYFQRLIQSDFTYPHFPNESVAEYYGASVWDPETGELTTGLPQEGRLVQIQGDIEAGDWWGIEELIRADSSHAHYTWGWSLVHFLMQDPKSARKFQQFYFELARGRKVDREDVYFARDGYATSARNLETCSSEEVLRVFESSFGLRKPVDVRELEREWYAHIESLLTNLSTRGLEKAAFTAYRSNRKIRAQRLLREAIARGSQHPLVYLRYAILLADDKDHGGALDALSEALRLDPLDPRVHLSLGRTYTKEREFDTARQCMLLAHELDEDGDILTESVEQLLAEIARAEATPLEDAPGKAADEDG